MSIDFDVNKVLDQLGQFIAAKGPVAYDAAVNVVKYDALAHLIGGGVCGAILTGAGCVFAYIGWTTDSRRRINLDEKIKEATDLVNSKLREVKIPYRAYDSDIRRMIGLNELLIEDEPNVDGAFYFGVGLIFMVVGLLVLLCNVGNVWNWIAVFHPDVALAKELFDRAMRGS